MKKQMATWLLLVMTVMMAAGCGNGEKAAEGTPAIKVNGDIITQEEVDSNYDRFCALYNLENQLDERGAIAFKRDVAAYLIETELILQEADRRGIQADSDAVKAWKEQYVNAYNSEDEFKAALEEQGVTEAQFDEMLEEQVIYEALEEDLSKDITIDAQAYYDAHQDEFTVGEQVKASHILVETEEEANDIIAQLDGGADFAELAKEKSIEPAAATSGGDLGYFTREKMVTEFSDAAFSQEVGTYSTAPVQSSYGFHVIYVEDKKPAGVRDFAEVEQSIITRQTSIEVNQKFTTLLNDLLASAEIEYVNADLDPDAPLPEVNTDEDSENDTTPENDDQNTLSE